jgi:pre-mRNA-splicing factor ISY1
MLNLFLKGQKGEDKQEKRPHLASTVSDLAECEKWRRQVIRDITREVAAIQNAALGEYKIREINDYLNKLLREKHHWEKQIKALGGPAYTTESARIMDQDGKHAIGTDGYYYFGAARELPGVRELHEQRVKEKQRPKRGELHKLVDAEYYGYLDEDDAQILELEAEAEARLRQESVQAWEEKELARRKEQLRALGMDDSKPQGEGE